MQGTIAPSPLSPRRDQPGRWQAVLRQNALLFQIIDFVWPVAGWKRAPVYAIRCLASPFRRTARSPSNPLYCLAGTCRA